MGYDSAYFDEQAAQWDQPDKVARAQRVAEAVVTAVPLRGDERLLDYGAGTGLLGRALADRVASITLADASEGMTRLTQERVATGEITGDVRAVRLDLLTDPVPHERYDVVVSLQALHHVSDVPAVLRALRELTVPGGWLAVSDLDREDGSFHGEGFAGHTGFERAELEATVREAGFVEVSTSTATTMTKGETGHEREYPLFLLVARAPA
ncbi:class I SAM-dependent methyltransferase [Janibacter melonis]|uniref:class I SAM-dependent methyltransferase n=1 Tax=Janibacter melonis TaxID=262209 RepID=UPI001919BD60|nr:class I SAM-dependent methyltransferase [Janibacter melonis]